VRNDVIVFGIEAPRYLPGIASAITARGGASTFRNPVVWLRNVSEGNIENKGPPSMDFEIKGFA
jgi:hypothetical protein